MYKKLIVLVSTLLSMSIAPLVADPSPIDSARLRLTTSRPANIFTESASVVFNLTEPAGQTYSWRVHDWQGNLCAEGVLSEGETALPIKKLPRGYFELEVKSETAVRWEPPIPFALVSDPATRTLNADSPFAVDSALSWTASKGVKGTKLDPEKPYEVIADIAQLSGVSMIRDRLGWFETTNPKPGVYEWGSYETTAALLAQRGIKILSLYESFPETKPSPSWTKDGLYDLTAVYQFSQAAARQFKGRTVAWEFWNEPDLKRKIPAWDFAASQKAAYLGFKKGNPDVNVLNGSISNIHRAAGMLRLLLDNGMGDYYDTFNLHTYLLPKYHSRVMRETQSLLTAYSLEKKPLWVTEVGLAYEGNGDVAPLQAGSDRREHGPDQARAQAERVVTTEVTLHALGAQRVFFFVLPAFNEANGNKAWGLLRWDWMVKPGFVALSNLTHQLGDAQLLGDYTLGTGVQAYLFTQCGTGKNAPRKGTQTLVIWSNVDRTISLPYAGERLELVDLMGKVSSLTPVEKGQYSLRVGPSAVYLNGLSGLTPATAFALELKNERKSSLTELSTILRIKLGPAFKTQAQTYASFPSSPAEAAVEVYNFSDEAITGAVKNLGSGYELQGLPERVSVPAQGTISLPVKLVFPKVAPIGATMVKLGAEFPGRKVAPAIIPVLADLATVAAQCEERTIPAMDVGSWIKNSSGKMDIQINAASGEITFPVSFTDNVDRWIHPALKIPKDALNGALALSFEIRAAPKSTECSGMLVLSDARDSSQIVYGEQPETSFKVNDQWQTITIDFRSHPMALLPEQIRLLRVGCNPKQNSYAFSLRNLKFYVEKKP